MWLEEGVNANTKKQESVSKAAIRTGHATTANTTGYAEPKPRRQENE
jgi:hypothetical protein